MLLEDFMDSKLQNTNNYNPGIRCMVNTCEYYLPGDHCSAKLVEVQHRNAKSAKETDCTTFKPKIQSMT
jgi:hypothetical protein